MSILLGALRHSQPNAHHRLHGGRGCFFLWVLVLAFRGSRPGKNNNKESKKTILALQFTVDQEAACFTVSTPTPPLSVAALGCGALLRMPWAVLSDAMFCFLPSPIYRGK